MKSTIIIIAITLAVLTAMVVWITSTPQSIPILSDEQQRQLDNVVPSDIVEGNKISTFTNFSEAYTHLLDDINGAENHVHLQFFKFEDDATGRAIGKALASCSARGVEARLMYDDLMCTSWKPMYRRLRQQRVMTAGFAPLHFPFIQKRDYYRNHRKSVVIDGRIAYIGGVNIADRYRHGLPWGCWRDTMIRIEGPAAAAVQRAYLSDWCYATKQLLSSRSYFPDLTKAGNMPVRIITSGPIGPGHSILDFTINLLSHATSYVWFESPYFIPPAPLREACYAAARRGVDIRILIPPRGDRGEATQLASKSFFSEAFDAGVKIATYSDGYMHSKLIVADDSIAVVGSCNIDPRSYYYCEEIAAVIESADYAAEIRSVFLSDESHSVYIDPAVWAARGRCEKLKEDVMRLVASQL